MAIALTDERTDLHDNVREVEDRAVLTPRGRAVARLIAFEDVWAELGGADRAYFASELEDLAWEARVSR